MYYQALHGKKITPEHQDRLCDRNWIRTNADHIYKDKVNIVAEFELEINGIRQPLVIKWFGWRNRISQWLSPVMRSRAKKSWDASLSLLKRGIKVPEPLAVYTQRCFGFIRCNFLLTKKIENYILARRWLRNSDARPADKKTIVATIAVMIQKMHSGGMLHHDLTPGNFLVNNHDPADIALIDLNRLKHKFFLTRALKMHDIAKLNLCQCGLTKDHPDCLWLLFLEKYDNENLDRNKTALRSAIRRRKIRHAVKSMRKSSNQKKTMRSC